MRFNPGYSSLYEPVELVKLNVCQTSIFVQIVIDDELCA